MNFLGIFVIASTLLAYNSHKISETVLDSKEQHYSLKTLFSTDFSHKYYCYEFDSVGYEIVDAETETTIEFSPSSKSPYHDIVGDVLTYDGPTFYGSIDKNESYYAVQNSKLSTFSNDKPAKEPMLSSYSSDYDSCIENYSILSNLSNFIRNTDGKEYNEEKTCGYLAAAMILYYSKYQFNNKFVDDKYIEYAVGGRRFTSDFHDYLYKIGQDLGKSNSTTAFDIKDVMSEYCKRIGINANHYAMLLSTTMNITMCHNDNKPVALFGNFVSPVDGRKVNHAVVCYGT